MAWESRASGKYLYRSVRRDGRVAKEYHGRGPVAELAANLLAQARARREAEAEALRALKARHESFDRRMADLDDACRRQVEATLGAAGCRKDGHYEWRRSVMTTGQRPRDEAGDDASGRAVAPGHEPASDAACREALDRIPGGWDRAGDLAAHAEAAWIDAIAGPDEVFQEALRRKAAGLRIEVAGPDPSPLEELLARRIAATWLQSSYADAAYARLRDVSLRQAEFAQRRMDAAHRRHTSAIAALAAVRRLLAAAPARAGRTPLTLVDGRDDAGDAGTGRVAKRSAS